VVPPLSTSPLLEDPEFHQDGTQHVSWLPLHEASHSHQMGVRCSCLPMVAPAHFLSCLLYAVTACSLACPSAALWLALPPAPAVCVPAAPRTRACKLPGDWAQCCPCSVSSLMEPRMCGWKSYLDV
jgi:hypothetical protein